MSTSKVAAAEFFGTSWLVFAGTGAAVLAAAVGNNGIGWVGVALAFGLTVVTMAYAVGRISGAHFNPATTIGLWAGGRFPAAKIRAHIVAQVVGAIAASAVLYEVASGKAGFSLSTGFAANGYGPHSPAGMAPLAIGLTLTLIHLVSIPVDNTSVNPARSLAPALFVGSWALSQLWAFIVFPIVGGILGGLAYRYIVELFLMGDGVHAARAGQDPRGAHASLEEMLRRLLEGGVDAACCGTCCTARGLREDGLVPGVRIETIHDLAAAVARSDKVVSF